MGPRIIGFLIIELYHDTQRIFLFFFKSHEDNLYTKIIKFLIIKLYIARICTKFIIKIIRFLSVNYSFLLH